MHSSSQPTAFGICLLRCFAIQKIIYGKQLFIVRSFSFKECGTIRERYLSTYKIKVYKTLNRTSVCIAAGNSEHKQVLEGE
jgi:hypothetical protein